MPASIRHAPTAVLLAMLSLLSACGGPPPALDTPDTPAVAPLPVLQRIETVTLANGMTFLLLPRHDVPLVSGRILVKVGNVDNPAGSTGLAHMFEHMAFKGTDAIGVQDPAAEAAVLDTIMWRGDALTAALRAATPDTAAIAALRAELTALEQRAADHVEPMAWPRLYEEYVREFNAYTSQDVTVYMTDVPSNNLEAWMLMESERLQHPVFREFYTELAVVQEERRQQVADRPEGMAWELLTRTAFTRHPYRNPTIGTMADLETLNPRQIREFHARYYTPGNMVGALVGDFDPAVAREMLAAYFGDIPVGDLPGGPAVQEPRPDAQRRAVHRQGDERRLTMAFPGFGPDDPRRPVAELLAGVLARGNTSRLRQRLDLAEGVARSVYASANGGFLRYPGLFTITVDLMPEATNEDTEAMIWQELARLASDPTTDARLDEIRRIMRRDFYFGLRTNADLAEQLVNWQAFHGSWQAAWQRMQRVEAVTAAEVTALARDLFRSEMCAVVYLEPADPAEGGES